MSKNPLLQVLRNSGHLLLMQAFTYGLPLITLPYLIQTVGMEAKGQADFATAIISFLVTFADFGLSITATQQVSIDRLNPEKLRQIVARVLQIRLVIVLLLGLLWCAAVFLVPKLSEDPILFLLTFTLVPAQVIAPTFFFQGQDKMEVYSRLTIISKILFTAMVFALVRHQQDYYLINPLNALGSFIPNMIGWYLLQRQLGGNWSPFSSKVDLAFIKDSFLVTISHLGQNAIGGTYIVIAGFALPVATLGQFNLADKLIWPFRQLIGAGFQATFPQVANEMAKSPEAGRALLKKLSIVFLLVGVGSLIGILIFAPFVVTLMNKVPSPEATLYLRLLSPLPLLIALQVPLAQNLVARQYKKIYTSIITFTAFLAFGLHITLIQAFQVNGTIGAIMAIEAFILISLFYQWRKTTPIEPA